MFPYTARDVLDRRRLRRLRVILHVGVKFREDLFEKRAAKVEFLKRKKKILWKKKKAFPENVTEEKMSYFLFLKHVHTVKRL